MDPFTLSELQAPQVNITTIDASREGRDLSSVSELVLNNENIDRLIAQSPGALRNSSVARKKSLLDDLQSQFKINQGILKRVPGIVAQEIEGRGISRAGARRFESARETEVVRSQLELASVIERLKGNISTAQALASEAAKESVSSGFDFTQDLGSASQQAVDQGAEVSAEEQAEIDAFLTGEETALLQTEAEERDRILALGEIINNEPDGRLFQKLFQGTLEDTVDELDKLSASQEQAQQQEERNLRSSARGAELLQRAQRRQAANLV